MPDYLLKTYNTLPISFKYGKGVWLFDKDDNRYFDALAGIAVTGLGHNHPRITKTIQQQAELLLHVSNLVEIPEKQALAASLSQAVGFNTKAFFGNSGAEAIEAAIKLCRLYGHSKGIKNPKIIVMKGAFHGRTMGALTASYNKKFKKNLSPFLPGFIRINYNDIKALEDIASNNNKEIVAVLLEPIQGEAGIIIPDDNYLSAVRNICTKQNWLMILDEVQTGMGRTGRLFAYQHSYITPDAITIGKGLANGIPIGALLVKEQYGDLFTIGAHGSTFGGNPLACAVGLATLQEIQEKKLWENAASKGEAILNGLKYKLANYKEVKGIRGKGLMIGIELDRPCREILKLALSNNIIFNVANQKTIRLLPPLIIEQEHVELIIDTIAKIIGSFLQNNA